MSKRVYSIIIVVLIMLVAVLGIQNLLMRAKIANLEENIWQSESRHYVTRTTDSQRNSQNEEQRSLSGRSVNQNMDLESDPFFRRVLRFITNLF